MHEKLEVYQQALRAVRILEDVSGRIPATRQDLRDQLHRAATSIPLNIAEGAGEFSPAEKARFYRIARRSTTECMAILDVLELIRGGTGAPVAKDPLRSIVAMLTTMVTNLEAKRR